MGYKEKIIIGTAFAATAGSAAAIDGAHAFTDKNMNTTIYIANHTHRNGETSYERGFSDQAADMACRWKISGHIRDNNHTVARVSDLECTAHAAQPAEWQQSRRHDEATLIETHYRTTIMGRKDVIHEERFTPAALNGPGMSYARTWDFDRNQVCVRYKYGTFADGAFTLHEDINGGCVAMPQGAYTDAMRQKLTTFRHPPHMP